VRAHRILAALIVSTLAGIAPPRRASADGGTVRLVEPAGPFVVTVFSAPEPLRVGPVDVSVLVQDRTGGEPVLDARVSVEAIPPVGGETTPIRLEATRAQATNKLLYATAFAPDRAGTWALRVVVRRGGDGADVHGALPVERAASGLHDVWPYLALPPVLVALYALRARLLRRRRSHPPASRASVGR
jgi:hypothetical protein